MFVGAGPVGLWTSILLRILQPHCSVELLEKQFPLRGTAFRDGLVTLITALKAKFPQHK